MLCKWNDLPAFLRTDEVRPYYEKLINKRGSLLAKRTFDFFMATILLIVMMPVLLLLALCIKLDSPGPVFYRQERVTQYGRTFRIFKFRTMVQNADQIGSLVTVGGDGRITRIGKKLRGLRLDELPQLINIWKGEMSFVGTRPEVPKYVKAYTDEMNATLLLPAGVTSNASIEFKDEDRLLAGAKPEEVDQIYIKKILPKKMKWNLEEISKFSLWQEFEILFRTVAAVIK